MIVDLRAVDGFMTARAPARAATQECGVIHIADKNCTGGRLLLEMAAQTKRSVARNQQPGVHTPMWIVASDATFAHGFMIEHERTGLRRVALGAGFILRQEFRPAAFDDGTFVRVVTVAATHLAFDDRMVRRQVEFTLFVQVTLKTHLRRFARIDDGVGGAGKLNVQTAGPMTGFAPDVLGVVARCFQMKMRRGVEATKSFLMTLLARRRTDISRAGNLRRSQFHPVEAGARNDANAEQCAEQQK